MGLAERLEKIGQPKGVESLEEEVRLFEAKKGTVGLKHGEYTGNHSGPRDQQPFTSHVLFAFKRTQSTSIRARERGEQHRIVPLWRLGHLYHSFPEADSEEPVRPQPFRLKIPLLKVFSRPVTARVDLLTDAHLEGLDTLEAMCTRAVALGTHRYLEGIPETVAEPEHYLIDKLTVTE